MDRIQQEQEMKEKAYAANRLNQGQVTMGLDCDMEPKRACLRERVRMDLHRAKREERKAMRLAELDALLDKHPDLARILDLLEEVRG